MEEILFVIYLLWYLLSGTCLLGDLVVLVPAGELVLELFGVELGVMDRPLALNRTICV